MAIARGAGTEILRTGLFEAVNSTARPLIVGVQHHIYTVLSIICFAQALNADTDFITAFITGYDSVGGTTARSHFLFQQDMSAAQTYVWNDKFSFNGFEPTDFAGPMDDATKQDAIADQGSSVAQVLYMDAEHASDNIDVFCTYIDQNNA
jgi:hypothetical protein